MVIAVCIITARSRGRILKHEMAFDFRKYRTLSSSSNIKPCLVDFFPADGMEIELNVCLRCLERIVLIHFTVHNVLVIIQISPLLVNIVLAKLHISTCVFVCILDCTNIMRLQISMATIRFGSRWNDWMSAVHTYLEHFGGKNRRLAQAYSYAAFYVAQLGISIGNFFDCALFSSFILNAFNILNNSKDYRFREWNW